MVANKAGKLTKDYEVLNLIGKGGFGEVKKVVHRVSQDIRAMKIIKKDKVDESYLSTL